MRLTNYATGLTAVFSTLAAASFMRYRDLVRRANRGRTFH